MRRLGTALAAMGLLLLQAQTLVSAAPVQEQEQQQEDVLAGLGEFADFGELDLGDLLNLSVSIAAAGQIRTLEEAPGVVSVVTKEDIRRLGARTLEELLELLPGIEVLSDGIGVGRIFIRGIGAGASSQNVLVLFDGHRLNEEITGGATQINLDIPVDNIEQLEVIRGPGSALFGANAFLGVINIVSQNADTFDGLEVTSGGGNLGTFQANGQWADWFGELGVSAFVQYNNRTGPNLPVPADGQTQFDELVVPFGIPPVSLAPGTTFGARDGVTANLQVKFRNLTLNSRYKEEDSESYIGIVDTLRDTGFLRNRQFTLDLSYDWELGDAVSMRATALLTENQTDHRFDVLAPGFAVPIDLGPISIAIPVEPGVAIEQNTKTRRLGGEITADVRTGDSNHLVVGAAYESEKPYEISTRGTIRRVDDFFIGNTEIFFLPNNGLEPIDNSIPEQRRNIASAYAQDTWDASPRVTVTAGLRWDDYSDFGSTVNPRLALVWRLPDDWNIKLLYGRAFRAPSFQELFFFTPGITGNPDLLPSVINTFEAAAVYRRGQFRLSADLFANLIRDLIVQTEPLTDLVELNIATFVNLDDIDILGIELEARRDFGFEHSVFANYTYQRPRNRATGDPIPLVPNHLFNLGTTLGIGRYLSLTSTLQVRGQRTRAVADPRAPMKAYGLVNMNLRVLNLLPRVELSARIYNVFDVRYSDPSGRPLLPNEYPQAGRTGFFKLSYIF